MALGLSPMIDQHPMIVRMDREQRGIERRYQSQGRAYARAIRLHAISAARIGGDIEQSIHDVIYGNQQIEQEGMGRWVRDMLILAYLFGQRRAVLENDKLRPANPPMRDDFESDATWLAAWLNISDLLDAGPPIKLGHIAAEMMADFYGNIASAIQRYRGNDDLADASREQVIRAALNSVGLSAAPDDQWAMPKLIAILVGLAYSGGFDLGTETQEDVVAYRYSTMRDNRVRETHAKMEGVTRRKGDPVWERWTPPCGWGCRCRRRPIYAWQTFTETVVPNVDPDPGWDKSLRVLQI